jgi:hypothetical protein
VRWMQGLSGISYFSTPVGSDGRRMTTAVDKGESFGA